MIQSTGIFLPTDAFTAMFVARFRTRLDNGLLALRDEEQGFPILAEWKTARTLLARFRAAAAQLLETGHQPELGRAWIEQLPGMCGTPWTIEEDDYAQAHIRTRTCLIPAPNCWSHSGAHREMLGVGIVNVVEHRNLCSEINLSEYPRVHLIVDVRRPSDPDPV